MRWGKECGNPQPYAAGRFLPSFLLSFLPLPGQRLLMFWFFWLLLHELSEAPLFRLSHVEPMVFDVTVLGCGLSTLYMPLLITWVGLRV